MHFCVSLVVDYWVGRHSGGTIWGDEGFFRIERGVNALNIEVNR